MVLLFRLTCFMSNVQFIWQNHRGKIGVFVFFITSSAFFVLTARRRRALKEDQSMRPEVRLSLPALTTYKIPLSCRPQLQSNRLLNLGDDVAPVPSSALFTMRHLGSRHNEVSRWQAQIFESIGKVDFEITAVEQQATQRLDILDQRPRQELCLDQAFFTLRLEKHDLADMAAGLLSAGT
ncbi:uncharacterized protein LOC144383582 isoform X2 [Gasterosteus aculeatus]